MGGLEIYLRGCSIICFTGVALSTASFLYTLNAIGWKDISISIGNKLTKVNSIKNQKYFIVVSHLFLGVADAILAIYEIFLIISPARFNYGVNGFARGLFYILSGFCSIGVAADLGIAGGACTLIGACMTIMNTAMIKCDCMRLENVVRGRGSNKMHKIKDQDDVI
ncbi:hypothetical protein TRFO_20253 [Tritrichomonas foetus]|uniref:Uncharacterized protein n=1 Tax=Tritrichomonas foetus TaxID=1144522 RepID=A0A1J4KL68_9EUKA|nr:hypothetical protein TRFO_20253 [Tritrichomonas foetus]|eukprot:OHT10446.1 hypothetical protein TRFO_20253 [Tritrichomonas foetus]